MIRVLGLFGVPRLHWPGSLGTSECQYLEAHGTYSWGGVYIYIYVRIYIYTQNLEAHGTYSWGGIYIYMYAYIYIHRTWRLTGLIAGVVYIYIYVRIYIYTQTDRQTGR